MRKNPGQISSLFLALFVLLLCLDCQVPIVSEQDSREEGDVLLAEVYENRLYHSDLKEMLPEGLSEADSLMRLRILVENWIQDRILLHEAEKNVASEIDIDQLLEDYRSSLLIHNFEQRIVDEKIDTSVSQRELEEYYEKNKDQYLLESTILRCHFIKISKDKGGLDDLREWWRSSAPEDFVDLVAFCNDSADLYMLDEFSWYQVEEITQLLPAGTLSESSMRPGRTYQFSDEEFIYFLRLLESVKRQENAPLSYIQGQAKRYIMHQRKLTLLENLKNELYQKELEGREVKVYID